MSKKPSLIVQVVGVAIGTVVAVMGGTFLTGADPSPMKGLVFSAVASVVAGIIFRKLVMMLVVLAIGFGLYVFAAPHIAGWIH